MTTKKPGTDLEALPTPVPAYDRNQMTFAGMLESGVDEVQGNDLLKDDLADALVGVPFLITKATFRRGFPSRKTKGLWLAYVSLEAVVADETYLLQRRVNVPALPFKPGEHIVLNDGSTGILRQIVAYLEARGWIELPEGPADGPMEECRFDTPPSEWRDIKVGTFSTQEDGFQTYEVDMRLFAARGIRLSEYTNDYTQDGKTRYLA